MFKPSKLYGLTIHHDKIYEYAAHADDVFYQKQRFCNKAIKYFWSYE